MMLICWLTIAVSIGTASSTYQCYRCVWGIFADDPPGEALPVGQFCKDGESLSELDRDDIVEDGCDGCLKIETHEKGELVGVVRMCGDPLFFREGCHDGQTTDEIMCLCYGDLCNSAPSSRPHGLFIVLGALLISALALLVTK